MSASVEASCEAGFLGATRHVADDLKVRRDEPRRERLVRERLRQPTPTPSLGPAMNHLRHDPLTALRRGRPAS